MAIEVAPTRFDADNSAGSQAAACNDWRSVGRFHVGTGHPVPTSDAGYTTACVSSLPSLSISSLAIGGSPYTLVSHVYCGIGDRISHGGVLAGSISFRPSAVTNVSLKTFHPP